MSRFVHVLIIYQSLATISSIKHFLIPHKSIATIIIVIIIIIIIIMGDPTRKETDETVTRVNHDPPSSSKFAEIAEERSKDKHKKEKKTKSSSSSKKRKDDDDEGGGERKRAVKNGKAGDENAGEKKKRKKEDYDRNNSDKNTREEVERLEEIHTLFFGQMPFDTKVSDIKPWLLANLNRHGCGRDIEEIRMAGGDGEGKPGQSKKFKGYAFVDFKTSKAAKKAMKLHDTLFRGRPVTVERCERKTWTESKQQKKQKREVGVEVNTKSEGVKKREGLKTLTSADDVEVVIKHACENSEGTLKVADFDVRLKSFLGLLPRDVCDKAANEIRKVVMKNKGDVKNKGAFYMGIVRKISNKSWEKKAAKDTVAARTTMTTNSSEGKKEKQTKKETTTNSKNDK
jgi:hypothetical protein